MSGEQCRTPTDPPPRATPAQIFTAFKRLPMTRPVLKVQPEGRTLVGLDTIFYTEVADRTFDDVDLVVEKIDFRASPEHYIWHFADGTTQTTSGPGAAYPHQTVTHAYERSGAHVAPSVTVMWAGEYKRQDESTWHEVPDRVEAAGPPVQLRVASANGQLVEDPS